MEFGIDRCTTGGDHRRGFISPAVFSCQHIPAGIFRETMRTIKETTAFCRQFGACKAGTRFARRFSTMAEVWDACRQPEWLWWILEKLQGNVTKVQCQRMMKHFPAYHDQIRRIHNQYRAGEIAFRATTRHQFPGDACDRIRMAIPNPFQK